MLGIEIGATGVAVAHVNGFNQGRPVVQSCRFLPGSEDEAPPLASYIDELGLTGAHCNVVLPIDNYSLILTEAPEVTDAELSDAVRWTIKDLIDFPVEDAVLDVFRLPDDANRGTSQMVYVAVSQRSFVNEVIAQIKSARLRLDSIDITELALRNLCLFIDEISVDKPQELSLNDEFAGLAILQLSEGTGNLNVIKNQQLYLSRKFGVDWEGGLLDPLPMSSLNLEIHRSLDYYERQMNQTRPPTVFLCGQGVSQDKQPANERGNFEAEIKILPLAEILQLPEGVDEQALTNCICAIGGALREEASPNEEVT